MQRQSETRLSFVPTNALYDVYPITNQDIDKL